MLSRQWFQYIDKGNKKGKIPSKMGGTVTCLPPLCALPKLLRNNKGR